MDTHPLHSFVWLPLSWLLLLEGYLLQSLVLEECQPCCGMRGTAEGLPSLWSSYPRWLPIKHLMLLIRRREQDVGCGQVEV